MTATTTALPASPNDWISACEIQRRFMQHPQPVLHRTNHAAGCRQVHALGGDFYDFVPLPGGGLGIAVGDASGKGLTAALMASNVQSSLRTAALFAGHDLPAALRAVNRQVYESSLDNRYATLFYGVFDSMTGTLRYVNAGHPPPMVIRRDHSIAWLDAGGGPVGMFPDWKYKEGVAVLDPGDLLIAYTDGVIEAANPAGEEWGTGGLGKTAVECGRPNPNHLIRTLFEAMDDFTHGVQTDDATILALLAN